MESSIKLFVFIITVAFLSICILFLDWPRDNVSCEKTDTNMNKKLILISLDGFRWDYLHGRAKTPTFDALKRRGVHAKRGLDISFISNTLPNHITLVTGLHPESHGLLDNTVYDEKNDNAYIPEFYDLQAQNDPQWYSNIEPIWVSNQIQRKDARSGVLMWMGGESPIRGVVPTRFINYTSDINEMVEMDHVVDWLADEKEPMNLAVVYVPEPDNTGHSHGPESDEVTRKIEYLDNTIQYLLQQLHTNGLTPLTDVIILADHGFTSVSKEKIIRLDELLERKWYTTFSVMPASSLSIFPKAGHIDTVYTKLKAAADSTGLFKVYKSQDIPERFHLKNHKHVPPIFALANLNHSFVTADEMKKFETFHGNHGYDNANQMMRPIFMAFGPSFKENVVLDDFRNVDVYPLMCHLLGIEPQPNNGSMEAAAKLLREDLQCSSLGADYIYLRWGSFIMLIITAVIIIKKCQLHSNVDKRLKIN